MKKKRLTNRNVNENKGNNSNFTFQQAFDYFLSSKKAEGLRKPTFTSYNEHFNFFMNWLKEHYSEVKFVNDLSTQIIRQYVNYLRLDHFNYKT